MGNNRLRKRLNGIRPSELSNPNSYLNYNSGEARTVILGKYDFQLLECGQNSETAIKKTVRKYFHDHQSW